MSNLVELGLVGLATVYAWRTGAFHTVGLVLVVLFIKPIVEGPNAE